MPASEASTTAVRALHESSRAHDRQDGHEALCTERWTQLRGSVDEIKGSIKELRTEVLNVNDRLNRVLAEDAREARNTAGWWRGALFRWMGWGIGLIATLAFAAQKLN